jgi:Tol biopolymer transport system component
MKNKNISLFSVVGLILLLGLTACSSASAETVEQAEVDFRPIQVDAVQVEIGVGSPIPVDIFVSGSWPDLCAQLAQVTQAINGNRITVNILASPAAEDCPPDQLGTPFRIALPLNIVEMAEGSYTINVNGVEASFQWPQAGSEIPVVGESASHIIAYLGNDGNLWVGTLHGMDNRQITMDATRLNSGAASDLEVYYYFPKISSDGRYVAVRRDEGHSIVGGFENTFSLIVYNLETGESVQVMDQVPAGFDWKPGTHLLAYAQPVPEDYFSTRGEVDSSLSKSIMVFDMDTRTSNELVKPEGSYAIYSPNWSTDGRYLAFEEVSTYEGSGDFAYYDFETMNYHTWGEAVGLYDWSADSNQIIYDRMTYTATGEERIYIRPLTGGEEQMISVNLSKGYAFAPAYSPLGDQIAYFVHKGEVDGEVFDLYIQNLSGGDPLVVGEFTSAQPMVWSSDGSLLFFGSGPHESQQISAVSVNDGSISLVAQGTSPAVATIVK